MGHLLAWLLPSCAAVLFMLTASVVVYLVVRRGLIVTGEEEPEIIPGIAEEPPFFDEHDVAMMEQHLEDPDFHGTVVELNGIKVGRDGLPKETSGSSSLWSWLRRGD